MRADATAARRDVPWHAGLPGLLAITAAYVSFLLHAQFGFLALVEARLPAGDLHGVMAAMGLAGIAASLATGLALTVIPGRRLVVAGLLGCAAVAVVSLACTTFSAFVLVAALVGTFTALLTVALASDLRALVPGRRLGVSVGIATGVAYFIANVPAIFHGGAVVQSLVPAALCVVAVGVLLTRGPAAGVAEHDEATDAPFAWDSHGFGFATLVASFLALVWLDSAAFRIVQETAELQGRTWGAGSRTLGQGIAHLAGAVVAGWLVDRGRLRSLLLATFLLFVTAFVLLQAGRLPLEIAGALYAVGISIYSTALVLAPSLGPEGLGLPRRWRAALLYAVAGWLGSALGVGMAQGLHRIPAIFVAGAGALLVGGALLAGGSHVRPALRAFGPMLALAALGLVFVLRPRTPDASPVLSAAERGRRVYVAEGCINCHSQYLRSVADEILWGPRRFDQLAEAPPLLGTRRIGPDLLDVGNRRSATWQRLHLLDPRSLSPGSRMPSYAHLFAAGDRRGDDLVAYLSSLGAGTLSERAALVRVAVVPQDASLGDLGAGRRTFEASCAPCHGLHGRGDGPVAGAVASPFLDLRMPGLPRVERVTGNERLDLERVVRFGIVGTSMPGHELLADEDVANVSAWVQELRRQAGVRP